MCLWSYLVVSKDEGSHIHVCFNVSQVMCTHTQRTHRIFKHTDPHASQTFKLTSGLNSTTIKQQPVCHVMRTTHSQ